MEQLQNMVSASVVCRWLTALCAWFGRQWQSSGVIQWFLHPTEKEKGISDSSLFYRLFLAVHHGLAWVYAKLRLEKLFAGSVFCHPFFWCALPVVLSPLMAVSGASILVLMLAAVGYASVLLAFVRDRDRILYYAPMNRWIYLYAAVYLAGAWFSVSRRSSLKVGALTVAFLLFAIVLENAIRSKRQLDGLIRAMVLVGAVVALYGVCQYLFGWGYQSAAWVDSDMFSSITFRVPSTFSNPNMLGQYFILIIPFGGACLLTAKHWNSRMVWLICCGLMCVCMLLTFSRGAWLGLLFAGAVFFVLLDPRLILLAPFAFAALVLVMPDTVIGRFTSIGNMGDASTSYRVYIWMGVLAMLKKYWLCGIGPGDGAFNLVYPAYSYNSIVAPHSHNLYLQIICDAGICELLAFLMILFHYFRRLCVAMGREKDRDSRLFQIAAVSSICGFLVQAMTDYSFYNYRVMFLFWAVLGIGAVLAGRSALPEREAVK